MPKTTCTDCFRVIFSPEIFTMCMSLVPSSTSPTPMARIASSTDQGWNMCRLAMVFISTVKYITAPEITRTNIVKRKIRTQTLFIG